MNYSEIQKEKIRSKYKGINQDELDVIYAIPHVNLHEDTKEKRVAVYARVSTDDSSQTSSYELQKNHYMDVVNNHIGWNLVDIYADEGISGTSLKHRDEFVRMINDCKSGKIDLIVTKSVSRFARNVVDCVDYARELKQLQPQVGIYFETENIHTLDSSSEMILILMATLAQEESHNKSEVMNSSIEMRFRRGIFLTPPLLGYDTDDEGNLVINERESKMIRLIFFMYLYGNTCQQIAETLTNIGCMTKKGNTVWSASTILQILQNERHCGDVIARKTWTPNYLDHKSKKNKQNKNQYKKRDNHEPIITRDDFIAVQRLIGNAKYGGNKGFLPELNVVQDGALKGFVSINPRWAAFKAKNYLEASNSVWIPNENKTENIEVEAQSGDFDLRKFEVARSQFFDIVHKTCVTFSVENIQFSTECVRKFDKALYVEMLVNPNENLFAVRPCPEKARNAVQWSKVDNGVYYSRNISCAAYIRTLYELFGWNLEYKYRVRGIRRQKNNEILMLFDMNETEIFISQNEIISEQKTLQNEQFPKDLKPFTNGPKKDIMAFPSTWADNFGNNYYRQAQARELALLKEENEWKSKEEGKPYLEPDLKVTDSEEVKQNIQRIISDMEGEIADDGE